MPNCWPGTDMFHRAGAPVNGQSSVLPETSGPGYPTVCRDQVSAVLAAAANQGCARGYEPVVELSWWRGRLAQGPTSAPPGEVGALVAGGPDNHLDALVVPRTTSDKRSRAVEQPDPIDYRRPVSLKRTRARSVFRFRTAEMTKQAAFCISKFGPCASPSRSPANPLLACSRCRPRRRSPGS